MIGLYVFIGGGIGSLARFGLSRILLKQSEVFPWATIAANICASLILAVLIFLLPEKFQSDLVKYMLMVGFCGGFSTFSTFGFELFDLMKNGSPLMALAYLCTSVIVSVGLFWMIAQKIA